MANDPRFEVYPQKRDEVMNEETGATRRVLTGEFGWRFRAENGQIIATGGEGFTREEDAERAVSDFLLNIAPWGFREPGDDSYHGPPTLRVDE